MSTTNILDLNNRIDELAKSYPANKVMMSDGVTSAEDKLSKKFDYAHAENISSLPFTPTKDGVAFITVGKVSTPAPAIREFSVNGVYVASSICVQTATAGFSNYFFSTATIPLSKGDELTSNYAPYGTYTFVPYATT